MADGNISTARLGYGVGAMRGAGFCFWLGGVLCYMSSNIWLLCLWVLLLLLLLLVSSSIRRAQQLDNEEARWDGMVWRLDN